jgi:hypothetical protein
LLHAGQRLTRHLAEDIFGAGDIAPAENGQIKIVAGALDNTPRDLRPLGILTVKHLGHAPRAGITIGDTLVKGLGQEGLQGAMAIIQKHHAGAVAGARVAGATVGFRPAMCEAPVGCDGVVENPTVRLAIETGQDADAAGRLLPGIGGDAVRLVEMS